MDPQEHAVVIAEPLGGGPKTRQALAEVRERGWEEEDGVMGEGRAKRYFNTDPIPRMTRVKLFLPAQLMFETFSVAALHISPAPLLALHGGAIASGKGQVSALCVGRGGGREGVGGGGVRGWRGS